jgi:hypothetical protein
MKRTIVFRLDPDRRAALNAVRHAPEGYVVTVGPWEEKRRAVANALYWARLEELAEQLPVDGRYFTADAWHEQIARWWLPKVEVALPSGKLFMRRKSTSELTTQEFSEYLEKFAAWAANKEVLFSE